MVIGAVWGKLEQGQELVTLGRDLDTEGSFAGWLFQSFVDVVKRQPKDLEIFAAGGATERRAPMAAIFRGLGEVWEASGGFLEARASVSAVAARDCTLATATSALRRATFC